MAAEISWSSRGGRNRNRQRNGYARKSAAVEVPARARSASLPSHARRMASSSVRDTAQPGRCRAKAGPTISPRATLHAWNPGAGAAGVAESLDHLANQINRGCSSCRVAFCKSSPCNDRNRTDWDHRPGVTSLGARLATTEPSMKTRGGSLAGRLLDRCITAELALNWPPDRAIKLPCWTHWSHAGPPLEPRWTHAGPLGMTSSARALRPAHPARPGMSGAHRTTFENARGIGSPATLTTRYNSLQVTPRKTRLPTRDSSRPRRPDCREL